jgi:CRP/FNR family transcriptional regulator, cyclic AMP receptor protein
MPLDLFAGHLAVLPLFRGLSPLQIAAIARRAERVAYSPGAVMIEENAVAYAAVLIITGNAARVSGPELAARSEPIAAGSLLGEAAMLIETTYGSTVVARTAVRAVHITRDAMEEQMLQDPLMADRLVQNLAKRLTAFADELRRIDALLGKEASLAARKAELAAKSDADGPKVAVQGALPAATH